MIKLSHSPAKLHKEVQAHTRMTRSGIEYARNVQLLWSGVLVENRTAGIVYQFAHGTKEAATLIEDDEKTIEDVCSRIGKILQDFYAKGTACRDLPANVLVKWGPEANFLLNAASAIRTGDTADLLRALAANKPTRHLATSVTFRQSLIHGDLHLGNVMLGDRDVLIDYARSDVGPVVLDVARLAVDLLVRAPMLHEAVLPKFGTTGVSRFSKALHLVSSGLKLDADDCMLGDMFLRVLLAQCLNYDSVTTDTKTWIVSALR